ncbi:hypothetical protein HX792_21980 [Pseudomonas sp. B6002]|uniref:dermonecrotic toxin domain-containing protein n=1 Tax=Pseudomonas sp. B6002 TaxID=2726978 RepID=UPI0015A1E8EE|nr:DUF6543 domain-containing protein [Pseudomonas sp. B6002]NVZ53027.1 hypothetical protein [Pseudomonas sp. B6002]
MSPDTPDPISSALDFDDPAVTREQHLTAIRALLTRRINSAREPSRTINQIHAAHERSVRNAKQLANLAGRAPRILSFIRHALHQAFGLDPDTLLFSEPPPPRPALHVNSLTDRALALFSNPGVPINLHHFTALSVQGPSAHVPAFNAWQALERVRQLQLLVRVNSAAADYWQQLAPGAWLSRRERWVELRKALFADQAFLAHQLFQVSDAGFAMLEQLIDAPDAETRQRAGGAWATVRVATVPWPHAEHGVLVIPGALHIGREGAFDGPQVIYLPGLSQGFHEFSSGYRMQEQLPELVHRSLLGQWWQYLPLRRQAPAQMPVGKVLTRDALAHSAQVLLEEQWNNEWGCVLSLHYAAPTAPEAPLPSRRHAHLLRVIEKGRKRLSNGLPFETVLDALLEWDRQRREAEIVFSRLSADLPRSACERQVQRHESGMGALLQMPGGDTDYRTFADREEQRKAQAQIIGQLTQAEDGRLFEVAFWLERLDGNHKRATRVLNAQRLALRLDAQLDHSLGIIQQTHLDRLLEVLNKPLASQRLGSDTRVLRIAMGSQGGSLYRLLGAFVVTTARAVIEPKQVQPVILVVMGGFGGMAVFDHLEGLSQGLRASFASHDGSVLWRCILRGERAAARLAFTRPTVVDYSVADNNELQEDFRVSVEHYARLRKQLVAGKRVFSEVSDTALGQQWLAAELREYLQVPSNDARTLALANIDFVRFAAEQAKNQPAWLATATAAQRQGYRRLQRRFVSSALAFEDRLWQVLPPLYTFARERLVVQLKQDGFYPELDVDQPLLDMPDDVSAQLCGWSSQCMVGDRHVKMIASAQRTPFSLLDLALHNLDAEAPWTEWRLNRARYLQPAWKERLNPRYLIKTLSALDLGGQYHRLIQRTFAPGSSALPRRLIDRATLQLAQMQAYSALRQGLSVPGKNLFDLAMTASAADHISLGFLRLCGHTLEHDRHIAGVLVITDTLSQRCLVYWPGATEYPVLAEYSSQAEAQAHLNRAGATADSIKALAQRVAPGWEEEALASYPGQPVQRQKPPVLLTAIGSGAICGYGVLVVYEAIKRLVRTFKIKHKLPGAELSVIEAQIREQIEADPSAWLVIVPTSHRNALALFAHARMLEIQQRAHASANTRATLARYRELRLGEQADATVRGLLSFIPVIGTAVSVYEMLLAAGRYHLGGKPEDLVNVVFLTLMAFIDVVTSFLPLPRPGASGGLRRGLGQLHRQGFGLSRLSSAPRPVRLLERFKKPFSSDAAVPLSGPGNKGVYVKNGELHLVDGEHYYPVYRRGDEQVWRVKSPGGEAEGELVLHIREGREWALGADAPLPPPQPGPSAAVWRPFAASHTSEWVPPSVGRLEQSLSQTITAPKTFDAWAINTPMTLTEAIPELGIFEASVPPSAQGYRVLQHNARHYRLLPDGSQVSPRDVVFITRDRPLEHAASLDIAYWLEAGTFDQPIPASWGAEGRWTFHRPVFSESLRVSLARAFPGMTANSRTFLIERLLELSDPSRRLTATHLLRLKATLERWRMPNADGQTDDLLRLLRPLHSTSSASIYIGRELTTPGFDRVDFILRQSPPLDLRAPTQHNLIQRSHLMQGAVRDILEQQGFSVQRVEKKPGSGATVDFSCAHPQSNNLYFVLTRWANTASFKFYGAHAMQLSDEWFNHRAATSNFAASFAPIKQAMDEGRLVKIIAGIQWTPTTAPTVFFVRFGSLKPSAKPHRRRLQTRPRSRD